MPDTDSPTLVTIGVHLDDSTRLVARPVRGHPEYVIVTVGRSTELNLFLDADGVDRLWVVLAEAQTLLNPPFRLAAA